MRLVCTVIIAAAAAAMCGPVDEKTSQPTSASENPQSPSASGEQRMPEARSLLGEPLFPIEIPPEKLKEYTDKLNEAQTAYEADPHDENNVIWLGRRLAYLGRYNEAIDVFSRGLGEYPDSFRLRRHRGHRFITTRCFDLALADLTKAAVLIAGVPDEVEPDGAPNAANQPTGTTQTNIYYHLGLAHYLKGEFEEASKAFRTCLDLATNDDTRCGAGHWLYQSLRRQGKNDEAKALLEPFRADMRIIENFGYHKLLLMYKGERSPESMLEGVESGTPEWNAIAYGVAAWHLCNGDVEKAKAMFQKIIAGPMWPAFGHIAAEAELRRMCDAESGADKNE